MMAAKQDEKQDAKQSAKQSVKHRIVDAAWKLFYEKGPAEAGE